MGVKTMEGDDGRDTGEPVTVDDGESVVVVVVPFVSLWGVVEEDVVSCEGVVEGWTGGEPGVGGNNGGAKFVAVISGDGWWS